MISVSSLCSYLYCPRKLYFNSVLGIIGKVGKETISGTVKHSVIEYINKNEKEIIESIVDNLSLEDIEEIYRLKYYKSLLFNLSRFKKDLKRLKKLKKEVFEEIWPILLGEAKLRSRNVYDFMQDNKVFGIELWEKLQPKYFSEVFLKSDKLGLRGRIDKIAVYNDLRIPLEIKSGKSPSYGIWPNHKVQIASYILLLKEEFPELNEGYIEYIDIKEKRKLILNPFIEEEIKELIEKVKELLNSKDLPKKINNESKCSKCGIRDKCFST